MDVARRALMIGAGAACIAAAPRPGLRIGDPAIPFDVFGFDWRKTHFAEMRGKVIMLNYWATWCAPCREELPRLDAYAKRHPGAPLQIFAVLSEDDVEKSSLNDFAKGYDLTFAWHFDGHGYGPIGGALPTTYIIDTDGVLRYAHPGAFSDADLETIVTPLLSRSGPVTAVATGESRRPGAGDAEHISPDAAFMPSMTQTNSRTSSARGR